MENFSHFVSCNVCCISLIFRVLLLMLPLPTRDLNTQDDGIARRSCRIQKRVGFNRFHRISLEFWHGGWGRV